MTWQRTLRHTFALPADELWAIVGDPTRWPAWSGAIRSFTLEPLPAAEYAEGHVSHAAAVAAAQTAPVRVGQQGHYLPERGWVAALHRRSAPPLRITELVPGQRLAWEQPAPGGGTKIRWTLHERSAQDTILEQQIRITGPLAPAITQTVGADLIADWPQAVTRLYQMAQGAHRPAAGLPRPDTPRADQPEDASAPKPLKVIIAGGSGTLGRALAADLATRGHEIVILTRAVNLDLPHRQLVWDGVSVGPWAEELAQDPAGTAVVNLAGRLVDARPTEANIAELRSSRVQATQALVRASEQLTTPLRRWVQGSTTAIWSDAGEAAISETTPLPTGAAALPQMTGVAEAWEQSVAGAHTEHLTILRTSIVLQHCSPALDRLTTLTRAGLGGRVGTGQQWFSWIHLQDWLALVRAALGLDPQVTVPDGILVAAAPHPVRNEELMRALRQQLRRPAAPPTPAPLVQVGSTLLRTDPALGLTGRQVTSKVAAEAGFTFRHPKLAPALQDLMS